MKGRWEAWEEQWLRQHWTKCTDKQIAEKLNRDEASVTRKRKHLGLIKNNGRPSNDIRKQATLKNPTEYSLYNLDKEERIKYYKNNFSHNWRYKSLTRQLLQDELDYYRHKYITSMDSMDSITSLEEDLLHHMIVCEINIIRIQEQIKESIEKFKSGDDDRPPSQFLYNDLDKAELRYVKYQEKLNLTRQQRMKHDTEEDITISTIVQNLMDKRARADADRLAGEMNFFKKRCKEDMGKMDFLLGGENS